MKESTVSNIPGFSRYYVSKLGRVYYKTSGKWKKMALRVSSNGYANITLFDDNKKVCRTKVHILVAKVWIPNPNNLPCVGHKDNVRTHNSVKNLYWCTYEENSQHMVRDGRHYVPEFKLNRKQVKSLVEDYINKVPINDLEKKYGMRRVNLYKYLDREGIKRNYRTNTKTSNL